MSAHAPTEANVRELRPSRPPPSPGAEPWGLLIVQEAILESAVAELAGLERRMAAAQTEVSVIRQGLMAVEVLARTCRLLETQRAAMLERLTELRRRHDVAESEPPGVANAARSLDSRAPRGAVSHRRPPP